MQSDPRTAAALAALTAQRENFRWALAAAVEQVGSFLDAQRAVEAEPAARTAQELGVFASGRLDPERFATLFAEIGGLEAEALERMERARDLLARLLGRGSDLYVTRVSPGADLRAVVAAALAEVGRAFAAARTVELARAGALGPDVADFPDGFAFRRWNRAERQIAPPLVVEVDGGDAQVSGLAEFLDGQQKIVLVVRGPAPAAPLARLVSEGVTVAQVGEPAELEPLAEGRGPAVIAVMPEGSARFTHLPGVGPVRERLTVHLLPEADPRAAVGSFGTFQQRQELALLRELVSGPPVAPTAVAAPVAAAPVAAAPVADASPAAAPAATAAAAAPATVRESDPVDQLAAWLLDESGLTPS
jgi:hypothetical protein